LDYTIKLIEQIRHRYITLADIYNVDSSQVMPNVRTLVDTGAFNSMVDTIFAANYGIMLPMKIPISIGGNLGEAQGCILPKVTLGNFEMSSVFALAFPFKDWLTDHVILGANVLNNWDFAVSRTKNAIRFAEEIPPDAPNQEHPYQNYFTGGKYVAVQDDLLNL
jgi:hypothetical protein